MHCLILRQILLLLVLLIFLHLLSYSETSKCNNMLGVETDQDFVNLVEFFFGGNSFSKDKGGGNRWSSDTRHRHLNGEDL